PRARSSSVGRVSGGGFLRGAATPASASAAAPAPRPLADDTVGCRWSLAWAQRRDRRGFWDRRLRVRHRQGRLRRANGSVQPVEVAEDGAHFDMLAIDDEARLLPVLLRSHDAALDRAP